MSHILTRVYLVTPVQPQTSLLRGTREWNMGKELQKPRIVLLVSRGIRDPTPVCWSFGDES